MIDFGKYEVMSFDCYGTLIDWEGGLVSGVRPILESHGVEAGRGDTSVTAGMESGLQAVSEPGAYVKYRKVLGDTVRRFGEEYGFEPEPHEVRALADSLRHWEPFPDTVRALRALKERYELAIITNADDGLFALSACLFHDHVPAKRMGLDTVWINRRAGKEGFGATPPAEAQPDLEVPDLETLVETMDR